MVGSSPRGWGLTEYVGWIQRENPRCGGFSVCYDCSAIVRSALRMAFTFFILFLTEGLVK